MGEQGGRETSTRERSLIGPVLAVFGGTAVMVAAMLTVLLLSVVHLRAQNASARRASDELTQSIAAERSVVDVETGIRGYLLTQDDAFLQPYHLALAKLPTQLRAMSALGIGPADNRHVAAISRSITAYLTGYVQPLVASGGRLSRLRRIAAVSRGKQLLDAIRARFDALNHAEAALRETRRAAADAGSNAAVIAAAGGLTLSIVLLLGLGIYVVRRLLLPSRRVAAAAQQVAAGQLAARVPEVGEGETAQLGHAFNEMARRLQVRDHDLAVAHEQLTDALTEAREVSTLKSNFVANMSHEIRTPLNGVVGMLELLTQTQLTAEQLEYVKVARASGDALMGVVNDVLDIAKIEAGRLDLEQRDFDLYDVAEGACEMVAATAASRDLELQSYVHDDVPRMVCGDRMRVGQILANLMSNAVKFTPEGEVVLEVSMDAHEDGIPKICFQVRDTGIGIAEDRVAELFEPFTQADAGTTRHYGGTGLGLTIVRELTRAMGGTVEARSELQRGSTFTCKLPLALARSGGCLPLPPDELRGLRVLIVDDNATNRQIFEAYVSSWGMRPVQAGDARSAMSELEQAIRQGDPFDVALLDFHMPGCDGDELAGQIRASPALHSTRLILLTSAQLPRADPTGGVDFALTKPVRQSRLLDAISTVIAADGPGRLGEEPFSDVIAPRPTGSGYRILVAEDQPVNWLLAERMLSNRGHEAANATTGEQSLEMLDADRYDLLLMDCQMPVLDGYETAREIRRREAETGAARLPIVAMTARAMEGDRQRCLAAGMDDYLAKPLTNSAVDAVLARWLPQHRPPALRKSRLVELRGLFPSVEEFTQVLDDTERDIAVQVERIGSALRAGDGAAAAAAAHRLAGTASLVGADALLEAATALEAAASDLDRTGPAEASMRERADVVRAALEAERADVTSQTERSSPARVRSDSPAPWTPREARPIPGRPGERLSTS